MSHYDDEELEKWDLDSLNRKIKELEEEFGEVVGRCRKHEITLRMVYYSDCIEKCDECSHVDTLVIYQDEEYISDRADTIGIELDKLKDIRAELIMRSEDRFHKQKFHVVGRRWTCTGRIANIEPKGGTVILELVDATVGEERFNRIFARVTKKTYERYKEHFTSGAMIRFRADAYIRETWRFVSVSLRKVTSLEFEEGGKFVKPKPSQEVVMRQREKERRRYREYASKWLKYVEDSVNSKVIYGRGVAVTHKMGSKSGDEEILEALKDAIRRWLSSKAILEIFTKDDLEKGLGIKIRRKKDFSGRIGLKWDEDVVDELIRGAVEIFKYERDRGMKKMQYQRWVDFLRSALRRGLYIDEGN